VDGSAVPGAGFLPGPFPGTALAEHLVENGFQRILFAGGVARFRSRAKRFPLRAAGRQGRFGIFLEFHHALIGAGIGTAAEHHLILDHKNDGLIRRHF
jgi:hypothetical protein